MRPPTRTLQMCIVNPELVGDLAQLVGSQAEVMRCLGISWNTWVKIRAGRPILVSVGKRLRTRILNDADALDRFRRAFPCATGAGVDRAALESSFFAATDPDRRAPSVGANPSRLPLPAAIRAQA